MVIDTARVVYDEQGPCNGRASVRPSVRLSRRSLAAAAGLLLCAK